MSESEKSACIKLSRLLSPLKANKALEYYGSALKAVENLYQGSEVCGRINDNVPEDLANCVFYDDPFFPESLKDMPDKPLCLYCRGNRDLLKSGKHQLIGIVGTRKPSDYGLKVVSKYVQEAMTLNLVTVSGMAYGIDTEVHRLSLDQKGKTIAVLGTGIIKSSPSGNRWLFERILDEGGLVISEFYDLQQYDKWVFPRRNRLLAGLVDNLVVVEAQEKSGALITADLAADYDRNVFVTPGSIFNINSTGCNSAARRLKAGVITSIFDIFPEISVKAGDEYFNSYVATGEKLSQNNCAKQLKYTSEGRIEDFMALKGDAQLRL